MDYTVFALGMGRSLDACNNRSWCGTGRLLYTFHLHQGFTTLCFSFISIVVSSSSLQSPWGVASGAIAGHLVATTIAILGGAFLANYISEKLVRATKHSMHDKNI